MTTEKLAIEGGTPLRTEPFGNVHTFGEPELDQLMQVVDEAAEQWYSGYKVREFEDGFARRHGVRYAVATDSGTGAIHAAVAAIDPEPGDEIITAPVTDIGSVLGIMLQNAIPVFSDWEAGAVMNQSAADIESRITERTRAIMVIHLFGVPVDMDAVMEVARRHGLPVIEDCSQAHLGEYKGRLVGTIGDMGCFSLGGKPLTAAGGGILITDNEELARRAKGFAAKGSEYDEELRNSLRPTTARQGSERGYSFLGDFHPMVDLMAGIGIAQLDRLDGYIARRRAAGAIIEDILWEVPGLAPQKIRPGDRSGYYNHGFLYDEEVIGVQPERFVDAVIAEGVNCKVYLGGMPLYDYPIFSESRTYGESGYPFVDERGNRRIDYREVRLPVVENELPRDTQGRRQQFAHRAGRARHRERHQEGGAALRLETVTGLGVVLPTAPGQPRPYDSGRALRSTILVGVNRGDALPNSDRKVTEKVGRRVV